MPAENSTSSPSHSSSAGQNQPLSPELVQKVADRVYALLLEDIRVELERRKKHFFRPFRMQGDR